MPNKGIFNHKKNESIHPKDILNTEGEDHNQPKRVLLLGAPGIGKSTLAQYCASLWWLPEGAWRAQIQSCF